jgi:hypothetical protein
MGVTLIEAATGLPFKDLNRTKKAQKIIYKHIHALNLPIFIKQTLLHMVTWDSDLRIPSVSLYYCLKDI